MQVRVADPLLTWNDPLLTWTAVDGRGGRGNRASSVMHCGLVYTHRHTRRERAAPPVPEN